MQLSLLKNQLADSERKGFVTRNRTMDFSLTAVLILTCLGSAVSQDPTYRTAGAAIHPALATFPDPSAAERSKNVNITHVNSTTSSIAISWALAGEASNGSLEYSVVGYHVKNGKFISDLLRSTEREFVFEHLREDTPYTVCVEIMERSNSSVLPHARCVFLRTIPYLRRDSVVVLVCTLGYLFAMGLLGYILWKRRVRQRNRKRMYEEESDCAKPNSTVRWRDLQERVHLTSIEENAVEEEEEAPR